MYRCNLFFPFIYFYHYMKGKFIISNEYVFSMFDKFIWSQRGHVNFTHTTQESNCFLGDSSVNFERSVWAVSTLPVKSCNVGSVLTEHKLTIMAELQHQIIVKPKSPLHLVNYWHHYRFCRQMKYWNNTKGGVGRQWHNVHLISHLSSNSEKK